MCFFFDFESLQNEDVSDWVIVLDFEADGLTYCLVFVIYLNGVCMGSFDLEFSEGFLDIWDV